MAQASAAVVGRGAAADLVHQHQAVGRAGRENGGGFGHFHHEGGAAARQIVGRADAGEDAVDLADARAGRRHEAAGARQQRDQRDLSHIGRFTAHVGAGDEQHAARRVQPAAVGREAFDGVLDHRMAARVDIDVGLLGQLGRHPVVAARVLGQRGQRVQFGQRRGVGQRAHVFGQHVQQLLEQPFLARQRAVLRRQHLVFPGLELGRDVALGVLQRLAAAVVLGHLGGLALGHFDIEAVDAVEFHAQVADAGALALAGFQLQQEVAAVGGRPRSSSSSASKPVASTPPSRMATAGSGAMARVSRSARGRRTVASSSPRRGEDDMGRPARATRAARAARRAGSRGHRAQRQPRGDAFDVGKGVERGAQRFQQPAAPKVCSTSMRPASSAEMACWRASAGAFSRSGWCSQRRSSRLPMGVRQPSSSENSVGASSPTGSGSVPVAARDRVQQHVLAGALGRQAARAPAPATGCARRSAARRRDAGRHVLDIEAGQRVGLEMRQQVGARAVALEVPVGHAGAGAVEREGSSALSAQMISAGATRCSSDSSWAGAHSVTRKSPLAVQPRPARGARALPPM